MSVHFLAIYIILILPIASIIKAVCTAMLLCALIYYLLRYAWLLFSLSYVAVRIDGGDMVLITRDGREIPGKLISGSMLMPTLTILNVLPQGSKRLRSVVIFPDSMNTERFRELRVLLKWGGDVI